MAGAHNDIFRLQSRVRAQRVIEGLDGGALVASRELSDSLKECGAELEKLRGRLEPSERRQGYALCWA